ncbi:MAG: hypothetical protein Kow0022_01010 [Phycisphaerales bacterium]
MRRVLQITAWDGPVAPILDASSGDTVGHASRANLAEVPPPPGGAGWRVCWSGWVGEADIDSGWFERVPGGWMPSSQQTWKAVMQKVDEADGVVLRPHARHLLSDGPGCRAWLQGGPGRHLLLDPVAMLEPEMLPDADEHIERLLAMLGGNCWGVVFCDVRLIDEADRGLWCVPAAAGEGMLDMERFGRAVERFVRGEALLLGLCSRDVALLTSLR